MESGLGQACVIPFLECRVVPVPWLGLFFVPGYRSTACQCGVHEDPGRVPMYVSTCINLDQSLLKAVYAVTGCTAKAEIDEEISSITRS